MPAKTEKLRKNILKVLPKLEQLTKEDDDFVEHFADALECFLDEVAMDDGFGTERQCDPRGDMRSREWSIYGDIQ